MAARQEPVMRSKAPVAVLQAEAEQRQASQACQTCA
jgi:hypothetical protein